MDAVKKLLVDVVVNNAVPASLMDVERASVTLRIRKQCCPNASVRELAKVTERLILKTMKLKLKKEL